MLLDEPFSALDDSGHRDLMAVVEGLRKDRLLIVVVHDLDDAILLADRLILLGGAGPTSVASDIRVHLSRPRSHEQKMTPEFIQLRNLVLESELGEDDQL
jgi:ABC-type nitrate/sulfonate/bicarbonate transport system ATPase subunit